MTQILTSQLYLATSISLQLCLVVTGLCLAPVSSSSFDELSDGPIETFGRDLSVFLSFQPKPQQHFHANSTLTFASYLLPTQLKDLHFIGCLWSSGKFCLFYCLSMKQNWLLVLRPETDSPFLNTWGHLALKAACFSAWPCHYLKVLKLGR